MRWCSTVSIPKTCVSSSRVSRMPICGWCALVRRRSMRTLAELTRVELKLFIREPLGVVLIFALPAVWLVVLAGVFGNTPDPKVYRGVGPATYYVAAYIGLVLATTGLITLPAHL